MQIRQRGVRAIALILAQANVFEGDRTAELVDDFLAHLDRYHLIREQPGSLGCRCTLLRLQAIGVLGLAADVVTAGDDFGSLQHWHVSVFGHAHYRCILLGGGRLHVAVLHQADLFLTGADGHLHAIDHDLLGGCGNRHQARGALAVESLAADRQRQTSCQRRQTRKVARGCTTLHRRAHHQVVDFTGLDAGAFDRRTNGHGTHRGCLEVVKGAAKRLGDRRTGG
ncbi:hypothetical protein D3C77_335900 [compost metagenome]